jgi:DNA-directed RNA polymerase subunit M/transcription elongation factor TFIIS
MAKTYCPSCDGVITIDRPRISDRITCANCGDELEIINVEPFEVDYLFDDDWEDEEDGEDEEDWEDEDE